MVAPSSFKVTDGIATGIINGFESFSLMNYDVIDFCLNEFEEHYKNGVDITMRSFMRMRN